MAAAPTIDFRRKLLPLDDGAAGLDQTAPVPFDAPSPEAPLANGLAVITQKSTAPVSRILIMGRTMG